VPHTRPDGAHRLPPARCAPSSRPESGTGHGPVPLSVSLGADSPGADLWRTARHAQDHAAARL